MMPDTRGNQPGADAVTVVGAHPAGPAVDPPTTGETTRHLTITVGGMSCSKCGATDGGFRKRVDGTEAARVNIANRPSGNPRRQVLEKCKEQENGNDAS